MRLLHRVSRYSFTTIMILIFLLLMTACGTASANVTTSSSASTPAISTSSPQGLAIHLDAYRFEPHTPAQMCTGLLVADGEISGVGQSHWNTSDGKRPADASRQTVLHKGYRIFTPLKLSLLHIYIDHRHQPSQEFVLNGGQVGADHVSVDEYPQITSGHYLLLFSVTLITGQKAFDTSKPTLYSAFPINAQGIVQLQPKLVEQGQVTQQEVDMPLSQVTQELAQCP